MTHGFIISFEKLYACNLRLHSGIYHTPGQYNQCYGWVSSIFPRCHEWNCLLLIKQHICYGCGVESYRWLKHKCMAELARLVIGHAQNYSQWPILSFPCLHVTTCGCLLKTHDTVFQLWYNLSCSQWLECLGIFIVIADDTTREDVYKHVCGIFLCLHA